MHGAASHKLTPRAAIRQVLLTVSIYPPALNIGKIWKLGPHSPPRGSLNGAGNEQDISGTPAPAHSRTSAVYLTHTSDRTTQTKEPMTSHQTENNAPKNSAPKNSAPAAGHGPHGGPHGTSEDPQNIYLLKDAPILKASPSPASTTW